MTAKNPAKLLRMRSNLSEEVLLDFGELTSSSITAVRRSTCDDEGGQKCRHPLLDENATAAGQEGFTCAWSSRCPRSSCWSLM